MKLAILFQLLCLSLSAQVGDLEPIHSPYVPVDKIQGPTLVTIYDDLRFPATRLQVGVSNPPSYVEYKGGIVLGFADEAVNEDVVYFNVQLPHGYKEGEDLQPHIHWVGEDNTAGNVKWKLTYSWCNMGDTFPTESTVTVVDANSTVTDTQNVAPFAFIDGTDKEYSSMLICSLTRNSTDAEDTYTGKTAYLVEMDFHYPIETIGRPAP